METELELSQNLWSVFRKQNYGDHDVLVQTRKSTLKQSGLLMAAGVKTPAASGEFTRLTEEEITTLP